ncbi:hypothetical protein HK096_008997, partial [Nowakowskiella sp. JEL0078]
MNLKIEEAKPHYKDKLTLEWQAAEIAASLPKIVKESKKKRKRRGADMSEHADDMNLVNDETAKNRKGWRITKFNRAVFAPRIRNPTTNKIHQIDPLKYSDNFKKLPPAAALTSAEDLTWQIADPSPTKRFQFEAALNDGLPEWTPPEHFEEILTINPESEDELPVIDVGSDDEAGAGAGIVKAWSEDEDEEMKEVVDIGSTERDNAIKRENKKALGVLSLMFKDEPKKEPKDKKAKVLQLSAELEGNGKDKNELKKKAKAVKVVQKGVDSEDSGSDSDDWKVDPKKKIKARKVTKIEQKDSDSQTSGSEHSEEKSKPKHQQKASKLVEKHRRDSKSSDNEKASKSDSSDSESENEDAKSAISIQSDDTDDSDKIETVKKKSDFLKSVEKSGSESDSSDSDSNESDSKSKLEITSDNPQSKPIEISTQLKITPNSIINTNLRALVYGTTDQGSSTGLSLFSTFSENAEKAAEAVADTADAHTFKQTFRFTHPDEATVEVKRPVIEIGSSRSNMFFLHVGRNEK